MAPPTWLQKLTWQDLRIAGVAKSPTSKIWNFVSGVTAAYNTATGAWDLTVSGGGGGGSGDVVGPASSVDDRVALFSGTTGKLLKQAAFLIADLIKVNGSVAFTADQSMGGHKLTNVANGSSSGDAVNFGQLSAIVAANLDWKDSVRLATTTALPASTRTSNVRTANANGALPNIDGVAPAVNDRILDKDHGTGADRGIWVVTSLGSGGTPWVLTRAGDADVDAEVTSGLRVSITAGTLHAGKVFYLNTADPITLNTTALTFAEDSQSVAADGVTLDKSGAIFSVKAHGIDNGQLRQGTACTVVGRSANSTGDLADIAASTNNRFFGRKSNALGFFQVDVASSDITGILPPSAGGIGSAPSTSGQEPEFNGTTWELHGAKRGTDLSDAGATLAVGGGSEYVKPSSVTLTAQRILSISTTGAVARQCMVLKFYTCGANQYRIQNTGTGGTSVMDELTPISGSWIYLLRFDGVDWSVIAILEGI
jgi:hypothetical protein